MCLHRGFPLQSLGQAAFSRANIGVKVTRLFTFTWKQAGETRVGIMQILWGEGISSFILWLCDFHLFSGNILQISVSFPSTLRSGHVWNICHHREVRKKTETCTFSPPRITAESCSGFTPVFVSPANIQLHLTANLPKGDTAQKRLRMPP